MDFLGEYTAGLFGHSNVTIAKAIGDAMTNGWSFGGPNSYERELARKVCWFYIAFLIFAGVIGGCFGKKRPSLWVR